MEAKTQTAPKPKVPGQTDFLSARLGKKVQVRLLDGKALTGTLLAFDPFTLRLEVRTEAGPAEVLVYKHAVAYVS